MRSGEINKDGASETRILHWILAQLRNRYPAPAIWERQGAAMMTNPNGDNFKVGTKGQADIRGLYRGRYFELEVKKPGEDQRPSQVKREKMINGAGGTYAVVRNPTEAFAVVDRVMNDAR